MELDIIKKQLEDNADAVDYAVKLTGQLVKNEIKKIDGVIEDFLSSKGLLVNKKRALDYSVEYAFRYCGVDYGLQITTYPNNLLNNKTQPLYKLTYKKLGYKNCYILYSNHILKLLDEFYDKLAI